MNIAALITLTLQASIAANLHRALKRLEASPTRVR
jgi:hypothetical protein